jgi:hypothetical protein
MSMRRDLWDFGVSKWPWEYDRRTLDEVAVEVDIGPGQAEQLAHAHARPEGAQQHGELVGELAASDPEELAHLLAREHPDRGAPVLLLDVLAHLEGRIPVEDVLFVGVGEEAGDEGADVVDGAGGQTVALLGEQEGLDVGAGDLVEPAPLPRRRQMQPDDCLVGRHGVALERGPGIPLDEPAGVGDHLRRLTASWTATPVAPHGRARGPAVETELAGDHPSAELGGDRLSFALGPHYPGSELAILVDKHVPRVPRPLPLLSDCHAHLRPSQVKIVWLL